jgi:hypothetical protein
MAAAAASASTYVDPRLVELKGGETGQGVIHISQQLSDTKLAEQPIRESGVGVLLTTPPRTNARLSFSSSSSPSFGLTDIRADLNKIKKGLSEKLTKALDQVDWKSALDSMDVVEWGIVRTFIAENGNKYTGKKSREKVVKFLAYDELVKASGINIPLTSAVPIDASIPPPAPQQEVIPDDVPQEVQQQIQGKNNEVMSNYYAKLTEWYINSTAQLDDDKMRTELNSLGITDKVVQNNIIKNYKLRKYGINQEERERPQATPSLVRPIPVKIALNTNLKTPLMNKVTSENQVIPRLDGVLAENIKTVNGNYKIKEVSILPQKKLKVVERTLEGGDAELKNLVLNALSDYEKSELRLPRDIHQVTERPRGSGDFNQMDGLYMF